MFCLEFVLDRSRTETDNLLEVFNAFFACHCFLGTLPRAGIGFGSLAAYWQPDSVSDASVATNIAKSIDVLLNLPTQGTFNDVISFQYRRDAADFLVRDIASFFVRINRRFVAKFPRSLTSNAVQIRQRNDDLTIVRNINTQ
jgi:hypothetical protein